MTSMPSPAAIQPDDPPAASILIVDDSIVARAALSRMIDATNRFMVAGAVGSVGAAMEFLARHRVDIVLLDLELPGTDGLTGLPDLLVAGRGAKILVVSATAGDGAVGAIQALALGAADTLVKPSMGGFAQRFGDLLEERLSRLIEGGGPAVAPAARTAPTPAAPAIGDFDIVAIGASTGGIHALSALLRALPADFEPPIIITQHLPASFMPYFAAQLALITGRPCEVAENHMRIRPGRTIIAPGAAHLCVAKTSDGAAVRLCTDPAPSGCLPSVDPMFASVAAVYGGDAIGVVLSGMGRDGSIGARALADTGAPIVVQDRGSSVVWGMPGAIAGAGTATAVLPPAEIGKLIAARAARP